MLTVRLANNGTRDVEIALKRGADDIGVERMFDAHGVETFDPTAAVEIEIDGNLLELGDNDELVMTVQIGT